MAAGTTKQTNDAPANEDVIDAEAVEIIEAPSPPALAGRSTDVAVREPTAMVAQGELSVDDLIAQHDKIVAAMQGAMTEGIHYGTIPGVKKPSLFKPGAESLVVLFRLAPHYDSEKIWHDDGHLTVITSARLEHIPTGLTIATGEGLCTTREARYAYRTGERECPECGQPQVRHGKPRNGRPGNWYCWAKQGGCGATWELDSDQARLFEAMETGKVPNPDLADSYNTVLKMANKRALVAAVLNGTAASDVFTQDVEDAPRAAPVERKEPVVTTSKGVEARADAPRTWKAIADTLNGVDPGEGIGWPVWIAQALHALAGVDKVADLAGGVEARDAIILVANGVANLVEELGGREFPPPSRAEVQEAFAKANSVGEVLEGPDGPLDPAEAAQEGAQGVRAGAESDEKPPAKGAGTPKPENGVERDNEGGGGGVDPASIPFGE